MSADRDGPVVSTDHPAMLALLGLMASKAQDLRHLQWRAGEIQARLATAGEYRINPTSYDELPGLRVRRYEDPEKEWAELSETYARMAAIHREISELQQIRLASLRDVDHRTGEFWVPTLLTGRDLSHDLDHEEAVLKALVDSSPVKASVWLKHDGAFGLGLTASDDEPLTACGDPLALLDLMNALGDPDPDNEACVLVRGDDWKREKAVLVPAGVLAQEGARRPVLVAGPHAQAFRHALRISIRAAGGGRGIEG